MGKQSCDNRIGWGGINLGVMRSLIFSGIAGFLFSSAPVEAAKEASKSKEFARPQVFLDPAPTIYFPGHTDSNSPAFWDDSGFHVFNSNQNPTRSSGTSVENLGLPVRSQFLDGLPLLRWIEAVHLDATGTLRGLYHREDYVLSCPGRPYFTVPRIGMAKSLDGGMHWRDLGLVLADDVEDDSCDSTPNIFFAGGVGDPSWIVDPLSGFVYILYSSYNKDVEQQGVQIARISMSEMDHPVGKVWRWDGNGWDEPGIGGRGKPVLAPDNSWHAEGADAFWGPSIHWNTYLGVHVVLLNRTIGPHFGQDGAYLLYVPDISDPRSWTEPEKIYDGGNWYLQVIGDSAERGTDSRAGQQSRFFMHGRSSWYLRFERAPQRNDVGV